MTSNSLRSESAVGTVVSNKSSIGRHNNGIGLTAPSPSDSALTDLLAVDDEVEMSLTDVANSGAIYIRLLVRAVGLLNCEDDVERLLLE